MSKLADYGTLILTTMVHEPERVHSANEIAGRIRIAAPTVSKILKILTAGGLVVSLRGARGGYLLARAPAQISVAEIIEVMDGPIGMTECSVTPGLCSQETGCPVRANWQQVNQAVLQALQQVTLAQMVRPAASATVDVSGLQARRPALETTTMNGLGDA